MLVWATSPRAPSWEDAEELKSPGGASGSLGSEQGGTFGLLMPPGTEVWTLKTPPRRTSSGLEMLRLRDKTFSERAGKQLRASALSFLASIADRRVGLGERT